MTTESRETPLVLDSTVREFLDALSTSQSTPGGGSASAMGGAVGAALVSMVASLTLASPKCADVHDRAKVLLAKSEAIREALQDLVQADIEAFAAFARAMKMPKNDDAEKAARDAVMQSSLVHATEVPLEVCRQAVAACELAVGAAEIGNVAAVSDAGVGAVLAEAAVTGASLNVAINVGYLKDKQFAQAAQAEADSLVGRAAELRQQAMEITKSRM